MHSAYELFSKQGVKQTGVNAILDHSNCAKASFYENFRSKDELALAFLDLRETVWTRDWLESAVKSRARSPDDRLLAIFDVFDGWFRRDDFEGCSFINVLLESRSGSALRHAAAAHLAEIRAIVRELAVESGLADPDAFSQVWHMLMKGSIVSAGEGNMEAAAEAKRAARIVLEGWPRA